MLRAIELAALAVLAAGASVAQVSQPSGSPAHGVGVAHANLMRARPCFGRTEEARLEELLGESLAHIAQTPGYRESYDRAMTDTLRSQRYIGPSDPVACSEIRYALNAFVRMHEARKPSAP